MASTAFLDESLRNRGGGLFLFAAVVVAEHDAECRPAMKRLRLAGQRRIHWRDESAASRDRIVGGIDSLPWSAAVVAFQPVPRRRQPSVRAECLGKVVELLANNGTGRLVIESRGDRNDRLDQQTMIECRRRCHGPESYSFARGVDEPLLWLADVVAGATSAHLDGANQKWFPAIREKVSLVRLGP